MFTIKWNGILIVKMVTKCDWFIRSVLLLTTNIPSKFFVPEKAMLLKERIVDLTLFSEENNV